MTQQKSDLFTRDSARFEAICAFARSIAHEFNNFLTPLTAYPEVLRDSLLESSEQRAILDVMEKAAKQMVEITNQLIILSSSATRATQPIDVNLVVGDVISQLKENFGGKDITIHCDLAGGLPKVKGVETEIRVAVENLCRNAMEAMDTMGGRFAIKTEQIKTERQCSASGLTIQAGPYVKVSVSDTGSGVEDRIRDKLFEPFVTTKKNSPKRGVGLGLTVAFKIAKDHGGAIDFASELGKGASFSLYLPAEVEGADAALAGAVEKTQAGISLIPCDGKRVLIVDDEKTILKLFKMILSTSLPGIQIDLAGNGQEALEQFTSGRHGVILMDLHMPVMDGQVAFARIEKLCEERNWEMPAIVFCTGFAPPDMVRSVVAENSRHHLLSKPISGQVLVEAVKARL